MELAQSAAGKTRTYYSSGKVIKPWTLFSYISVQDGSTVLCSVKNSRNVHEVIPDKSCINYLFCETTICLQASSVTCDLLHVCVQTLFTSKSFSIFLYHFFSFLLNSLTIRSSATNDEDREKACSVSWSRGREQDNAHPALDHFLN